MSIDLTDIKGIGPKTKEKLEKYDITTVEALALTSPEELKEILRISYKDSKEIIRHAKELALDTAMEIKTLQDMKDYREKVVQRISTGSTALDNILGGGIETDCITGLRGPFSTGKTQLCYQVAVNCIGDLKRLVAWIETEPGSFRPERILEIAKARGIAINMKEDFLVIPAKFITDVKKQMLAYERIKSEIDKGVDIGLIVVDSFNKKFREFFKKRESFHERSMEMARHLGFLSILASKYNIAILLTCQVMGIPDTEKVRHVQMTESSPQAVYGGSVLKHDMTVWISLKYISGSEKTGKKWSGTVIDSSYLPKETAIFTIDSTGIRDIKSSRGIR